MSSIDNQLSSCTEENVILVNQSSIVKIESNPLEDRISIMKMTIHDLDNEAHDGVGCAHEDSY